MSILEHWRMRHPGEPGSTGRLIVLILLLVVVLVFILNSDKIARGFSFFLNSGPVGVGTTE
jgi:hypothetical protein